MLWPRMPFKSQGRRASHFGTEDIHAIYSPLFFCETLKILFLPGSSLVPVNHLDNALVSVGYFVQKFEFNWDTPILDTAPAFYFCFWDLFDSNFEPIIAPCT